MLMKLTNGVNFINMLTRNFYTCKFSSAHFPFHQQYYVQLYLKTLPQITPQHLHFSPYAGNLA